MLTTCHNNSGKQKYKAESPSRVVKRNWEGAAGQRERVCMLRGGRAAVWSNYGTGSDFTCSKRDFWALKRNEVLIHATIG